MMKNFIVKIKNNIQLVTIVLIIFFGGVEQNKWTRIIEIICWILCTTFLILDIKKRISNLKKDNDPDDRV